MAHAKSQQKAFIANVHGRVQGVGFRYSARREAMRLSVNGWVKNNEDGTVEVYAEGDSNAVRQFSFWLREGPPGASVHGVDFHEVEYRGTFQGFSIRT